MGDTPELIRKVIEEGAATDIDWRAKCAAVLSPDLFADLEEWTLLTAMNLPADDDVPERVKAAVGEDQSAKCYLWMLIDLAQQEKRGRTRVGPDPVISDLNLLSLIVRATRSQPLSDRDREEAQDAVTRIRDAWEAR